MGRLKKERIGYPTQKPVALYQRIIKASSNPGDIVLDPFAGCATTLVAAELLHRQWIGVDIWHRAHEIVVDRMRDAVGLIGEVTFTDEPPVRTDGGETAAPFLRVQTRVEEPDGPRWSRAEMYAHLLEQNGSRCMGCDREFDDPRYLELDHNTPRSDSGLKHISNRVLLCGPCNRLKSNTYTLSGLRRENARRGHMRGGRTMKTLAIIGCLRRGSGCLSRRQVDGGASRSRRWTVAAVRSSRSCRAWRFEEIAGSFVSSVTNASGPADPLEPCALFVTS